MNDVRTTVSNRVSPANRKPGLMACIVIPSLWRQRQKDCQKFKVSLGYIMALCQKKWEEKGRAYKMADQMKVPSTKPGGLSLIPRTYMVEGES